MSVWVEFGLGSGSTSAGGRRAPICCFRTANKTHKEEKEEEEEKD